MKVTPQTPDAVTIHPPELIQSLVGGFNIVASNIYLILLPVILDLLLWFGPHLRAKALVEPDFNDAISILRANSAVSMAPLLDSLDSSFRLALERFNLLSLLSTFPIGIPSLIAGQQPMQTPFGIPFIYEIRSYGQYFLVWIGFSLIGLFFGCLYFATIAQVCGKILLHQEASVGIEGESNGGISQAADAPTANHVPSLRLRTLAWEFLQVLILILMLLGTILVLTFPAIAISLVLAAISPFLSSAALIVIIFSAIWFMIPLIFSPHGIFLGGQSVLNAMLSSIRLVRYIMPGTGMFLLAVVAINMGQGLLWRTPTPNSWMMLVGVLGNAFVITALLAASFVYYRSGMVYVQSVRKILAKNF